MNECENCGCTIFPCVDEIAFMFKGLTGHHPSCVYAPKRYVWNLLIVIRDLVNGIDAWAADEEGVHPAMRDALVAARKITHPVQGVEVVEHLEKLCLGESPATGKEGEG